MKQSHLPEIMYGKKLKVLEAIRKGDRFYVKQQYEEARQAYTTALLGDKDNGDIYLAIAKCVISTENVDRGLKIFAEAKKLKPYKSKEYTQEIIALLLQHKFYVEALEYFKPTTEAEFVEGMKPLLKDKQVDLVETQIEEYLNAYPKAFEQLMEDEDLSAEIKHRLGNREKGLIRGVQQSFLTQKKSSEAYLEFLRENDEAKEYAQLDTMWADEIELFQNSKVLSKVINSKKLVLALSAKIHKEQSNLKQRLKTKKLEETRWKQRDKLKRLEVLGKTLVIVQPSLESQQLISEIKAYSTKLVDIRAKVASQKLKVVNHAFEDADVLLKRGTVILTDSHTHFNSRIRAFINDEKLEEATKFNEELLTKFPTHASYRENAVILTDLKKEAKAAKKRQRLMGFLRKAALWLILFGAGCGGIFWLSQQVDFSFAGNEKELYVLATNLNLRETKNITSRALGAETYGTAVTVLEKDDTWAKVQISGGQVGYMKLIYLVSYQELQELDAILEGDETLPIFDKVCYKRAVLDYFEENDWIGDIPYNKRIEFYGEKGEDKPVWRIFGLAKGTFPNKAATIDMTKNKIKELVCIMKSNNKEEKLVVFSFSNDGTAKVRYEETLENMGNFLKKENREKKGFYLTGECLPLYYEKYSNIKLQEHQCN